MGRKSEGVISVATGLVGASVQGNERASIELDWVPTTGDTVEFQAQAHPEGTFGLIEGFPMDDINGAGVTEGTDIGVWIFDVKGISRIRAIASALGSTPVSVKIYAE